MATTQTVCHFKKKQQSWGRRESQHVSVSLKVASTGFLTPIIERTLIPIGSLFACCGSERKSFSLLNCRMKMKVTTRSLIN